MRKLKRDMCALVWQAQIHDHMDFCFPRAKIGNGILLTVESAEVLATIPWFADVAK